MKSTYKRLGDHISESNIRNSSMSVTPLLGININKYFMPSIANVIGTDMSTYKVVKPNQFACNRMHVGRDLRLPIAISKHKNDFIVSPAYDVFEVVDPETLNPDFLMMWFKRGEFDRNAWFYTDADVRGGLSWQSFCNMDLPIPSLEKQMEIVGKYSALENRKSIHEKMIESIEQIAFALYKQWFIDFEFLTDNQMPYKSSGGRMRAGLVGDIPEKWAIGLLSDLIEIKYGKEHGNLKDGNIPLYGSGGLMRRVNKALYEHPSILIPRKGTLDNVMYVDTPFWCIDTMFYSMLKDEESGYFTYYLLKQLNFSALDQGSAVPSMTTALLNSIKVILPDAKVLGSFNLIISRLKKIQKSLEYEIRKLNEFQNLLLSKLSTIES